MNARNKCWVDPGIWPRDDKDYIFLARAVDTIGRAISGNAWEGSEWAKTDDAAKQRFEAVIRKVADLIADGDLAWATRTLEGGDLPKPQPRDVWSTERFGHWFENCQMNMNHPEPGFSYVKSYRWIFVSKPGLALAEQNIIAAKKSAPAEANYISGGRNSIAFERLFRDLIAASPDLRTHSKEELCELAPELHEAEVVRIRDRVLNNPATPDGTRKAWTAPGRPTKKIAGGNRLPH